MKKAYLLHIALAPVFSCCVLARLLMRTSRFLGALPQDWSAALTPIVKRVKKNNNYRLCD